MDPIKQLSSPVAEIRKQVETKQDEYGETWLVIDGIETKAPSIKAAQALCAQQDAVRVAIRAALDETGIRDKTVKAMVNIGTKKKPEMVEAEMVPPGLADVFQINMSPTPANIEKATALTEAAERALVLASAPPPPPPTRWQRLKRTAKRLLRRKKGRRV